jgi:hypothetical protein
MRAAGHARWVAVVDYDEFLASRMPGHLLLGDLLRNLDDGSQFFAVYLFRNVFVCPDCPNGHNATHKHLLPSTRDSTFAMCEERSKIVVSGSGLIIQTVSRKRL